MAISLLPHLPVVANPASPMSRVCSNSMGRSLSDPEDDQRPYEDCGGYNNNTTTNDTNDTTTATSCSSSSSPYPCGALKF